MANGEKTRETALVKHESHGQAVANPHKDYVVPRIRRVEFLYA